MARYAYDVDKQTKYLDIHKFFSGGLKTVDTDDSLGASFLRQAENVSLSEFGFIEKRYGTYADRAFLNLNDKLQGYWEYAKDNGDVDRLTAMNGYIYLNDSTDPLTATKESLDYEYLSDNLLNEIFEINFGTYDYSFFQPTRDMNAVRIDDILYIFTGKFPVYYKGDSNLYLMPNYIPDEFGVKELGHNLMDSDFENSYGFTGSKYILSPSDNDVDNSNSNFSVNKTSTYPIMPYTRENTLTMDIALKYPSSATTEFEAPTGSTPIKFYQIQVDKVQYRPAGGVELSWQDLDPEKYLGTLAMSNDTDNTNISTIRSQLGISNPALKTPDAMIGTDVLRVVLNNFESGFFDFRVKLRGIVETYIFVNSVFEDYMPNYVTMDVDFRDITIYPEKVEDYKELKVGNLSKLYRANKVIEHYGKLMVWGSPDAPQEVFISSLDYKNYFPSYHTLEFQNEMQYPVESIAPFMNILVVQTKSFTWGLKGTSAVSRLENGDLNSNLYTVFTINPSFGAVAYKSVRPVRNQLFFLSDQGIASLNSLYAVDMSYNVKFVDRNISNIVPYDEDAVGIQFDSQYWINFPNHGFTLRYYIDKNAWVKDVYDTWHTFNGVSKYFIKGGKLFFATHGSVKEIGGAPLTYIIGVDYSLPYDLGKGYLSKVETSFMNQNYPFHPKTYKEVKYDFTIQNEYNISKTPIFNADVSDGDSSFSITAPLKRNHTYQVSIEGGFKQVTSVSVMEGAHQFVSELINPVDIGGVLTYDLSFYYDLPDSNADIVIGYDLGLNTKVAVHDITYTDGLLFKTLVLSENEKALNVQTISNGYDADNSEVVIVAGTDSSDWVFGATDFGTKITAVKTIKLSGKGYNVKVYMEDSSNAKWTLESLGITYKMRRARSK